MTQPRNLATAFLAVVVAALAVAGAGVGAPAAPLKLMVITAVGTPIQNYPDAEAGAKAAAAAINRRGGIRGRQLEILVCNQQSNANTAAACARRAVEEKVAAVVGESHNLNAFTLPILAAAGIPSIGLQPFATVVDWSNPYSFPLHSGSLGNTMGLVWGFKALGAKRVALVPQETATALAQAKLLRNTLKAARLQYAGVIPLPTGISDYSPYVQRLREMNADTVIMVAGMPSSLPFIRTAASVGIRPHWGHNAGTVGEPEAETFGSLAEGMLLGSNLPSFRQTTYRGIRVFNAEMSAAGYGGDPIYLRSIGLNAWLSVYAVQALAQSMTGEIDNRSLFAAANRKGRTYKLFDLVEWAPGSRGPAAFPRYSNDRQYFLTIKDGKIVASPLKPLNVMKLQRFNR
jgi:ABC-type branched-subunit amino acid transport system substrate-binding protein